MKDLPKEITALAHRYDGEVSALLRSQRTLPSGERALVQTHANVKTACADELRRIVARCQA